MKGHSENVKQKRSSAVRRWQQKEVGQILGEGLQSFGAVTEKAFF